MQEDILAHFERAIKHEIAQRSMNLGMKPLPIEDYRYLVGVNNGLAEAIEIIKKTASDLLGDDDEE